MKSLLPTPHFASASAAAATDAAAPPDWLDLVVRRVAATDYGVVQVVVHDGRVVQVEWTQRSRFDASRRGPG